MAANIGNLDIGLVVGFFGGMVAFFQGFRAYGKSRILQDTPETPIRSIAMGFVRIHGKAKSDQLVESPVTHTPCCYYIVQIHRWEEFKDGRAYSSDEERGPRAGWMPHGGDADGGWFYLEDTTGHVLVDPHGAQYKLDMTGTREVDSMAASRLATSGVSDQDLLAYVARVGLTPPIPGVSSGGALKMLGSMMEQEQTRERQMLEAEGPQSDPRIEDLRLAQLELAKIPIWDSKYGPMSVRINKMLERNRRLGLSRTVALPQPRPQSYDVAAPVPDPPAPNLPLASDPPFSSDRPIASGRYRLIEQCILPDHEYDISGTCEENRFAKDVNDRNLIRKGKNEPTFLISCLPGGQVNTLMQR
ncbi:MAG TPA: hypothetical protein VEN79_11995 [Terriglobia bacterium]|nr:hypothetical protein [Terriglobia bacterium]